MQKELLRKILNFFKMNLFKGLPGEEVILNNYVTKVDEIDKILLHGEFNPEYELYLEQCKFHRDGHRKVLGADECVVLVHPLHIHSNPELLKLNEEQQQELWDYNQKLARLLRERRPGLDLLLWEQPINYHLTSLWLEQGLVDDALFTYYATGEIREFAQIKRALMGKTVYVLGSCNLACVSDALRNISGVVDEDHIKAVRGMVLNWPLAEKNLCAEKVEQMGRGEFKEVSGYVSIEELLRV